MARLRSRNSWSAIAAVAGSFGMLLMTRGFDVPAVATGATIATAVDVVVNRIQKGDRLRLAPRTRGAPEFKKDSKLADGCEPLLSSMIDVELGKIAGRCIS